MSSIEFTVEGTKKRLKDIFFDLQQTLENHISAVEKETCNIKEEVAQIRQEVGQLNSEIRTELEKINQKTKDLENREIETGFQKDLEEGKSNIAVLRKEFNSLKNIIDSDKNLMKEFFNQKDMEIDMLREKIRDIIKYVGKIYYKNSKLNEWEADREKPVKPAENGKDEKFICPNCYEEIPGELQTCPACNISFNTENNKPLPGKSSKNRAAANSTEPIKPINSADSRR